MNNQHSSRIFHTLLIIYLVNKIICCINLLSPFEKFISTPSPVHKESEQRLSDTVKRLVLKQILLIQEKVALGMGSARMKNFSSNVCFAAMHI